MASYLLLYYGGSMPNSEAEQKTVVKEWEAWYGMLGSALVDPGNPFTIEARSVSSEGRVCDGPVGVMSSGYSIIRADTLNAAAELARSCPVLKSGAKISVFETYDVREM